jgi:hypothetical protein
MPARIGTAKITVKEYDRIIARFRELGRSDQAIEQIAREFNRGVSVIRRLRARAA